MKNPFLICALCLIFVAGVSGCGSDDATSSETQESSSASTTVDDEGKKSEDAPLETSASKVVVGDYEQEGPFSAVAGGKGNQKPEFTPSGHPAPKQIITRDLEVGSGPSAQRGDEVSVYFAGAMHDTGRVELYGWPPAEPSAFEIGSGLYGQDWEKALVGMKAGGIRQLILPSSEFAQGEPVDYVVVMTALKPKSE